MRIHISCAVYTPQFLLNRPFPPLSSGSRSTPGIQYFLYKQKNWVIHLTQNVLWHWTMQVSVLKCSHQCLAALMNSKSLCYYVRERQVDVFWPVGHTRITTSPSPTSLVRWFKMNFYRFSMRASSDTSFMKFGRKVLFYSCHSLVKTIYILLHAFIA